MLEKKEVIVEAENYDQAVAKALTILGTTKTKVDITVIAQQKHGLLGFGKKSITVRVITKPDLNQILDNILEVGDGSGLEKKVNINYPEDISSNNVVSKDGSISIVDGVVIVKDPDGGGRFPVIYPVDRTVIRVNGAAINEPTVVNSQDSVIIEPIITQPSQTVDILVSEDKLTAYLLIQRVAYQNFIVEDSPVAQVLKPRITSNSMVWPEPLALTEILAKIEQNKIGSDLDSSALECALNDSESPETKVIIARGKPTVNASGGEITLKINQGSTTKNLNPYGEGIIDSVEAGAVIAVKSNHVLGEAGVDVYGAAIQPGKSRDVELIAREGAKVIKDG
ncbi:MAG: flagellar assembly protein A, partial [Carboxydocellales bacterium]